MHYASSNFRNPYCVFVLNSAQDVADALYLFKENITKFAVRGGGHMPIGGSNSINAPGVMLSMSNQDMLALSDDKSVVSVGPGHRWADVYEYLEPHCLVVVGSRIGLSFNSSQYGFASDNVVKYEVTNGIIIEATTDNSCSDLFWALKSGGNSLCIVTGFDLSTFTSPQVWVGTAQCSSNQSATFLDAVSNFAYYGALNAKAAITPIISFIPSQNKASYLLTKFYDSETDLPEAWQNFSSPNMSPSNDTYKLQPLSTFINVTTSPVTGSLRRKWRVISSIADREALEIIHATMLDLARKRLMFVNGGTAGLAFQLVTKEFIRQGELKGGDPQGIDISRVLYFWTVLQLAWANKGYDDQTMDAFTDEFAATVNDQLASASRGAQYLFMDDAGEGQRVFESYGAENLEKLKATREKYDPLKV
ncbi:FAD binding domain-containing protein [Setomelanomma holmii]|uniref:FAD binding domain-containing protein n=1 Tax=Setomelanomma holmii TaxID=210430 RepID=A0A9P4LG18_9PLEO|nr:FAD binding domain-containing protein [Setomelanomma holmii]